MLAASFWLQQATILFIMGCHCLLGWAVWRRIPTWGKALTFSAALLWLSFLMRARASSRALQSFGRPIQWVGLEELLFWSAVSFLCALVWGSILRRVMAALVPESFTDSTTSEAA